MISLQNAENALKTVYLGALTELINTKTNPLLAKIEQTSSDVWGKEIRKAAVFGITGGIGAGDEAGSLPTPSGSQFIQFVATLKNLYGQIEISDKVIRASSNSKGAFIDVLNYEIESLLNASKFNLGRMLYGDGSGLLCTIANSDNKTVVVDSVRNIIEGMVVDIYVGNALKQNNLVVMSVDRTNGTIGLDKAVTVTDGSIYVQGSKDKEITGLGAIFKVDGSIYGLSKNEYKFLNPYIKNDVGAIDEIVMQQAIDYLEMNANSVVDMIVCAADVKYAYQEYMAQYKRNIDIMELKGGYKTLSYNGIPLVYDRFVEDGVMYLLNTKAFKLHQLCDWKFIEGENGKVLRQISNKPAYTATLVKYCELICDRPNGQAKLSGIKRE